MKNRKLFCYYCLKFCDTYTQEKIQWGIKLPEGALFKKIFVIRDQKVLMDSDLVELYGIEPRALKQAVRRNIRRFPTDFMFELSKKERQSLRSQIVSLEVG